MPSNAIFHLGHHCLQKYLLTGGLYIYLQCIRYLNQILTDLVLVGMVVISFVLRNHVNANVFQ